MPPPTPDLDRRSFLQLLGYGVGVSAGLGAGCSTRESSASAGWVTREGLATWFPPQLPLPAHGDGGSAATDARRLAAYEVRDELVLPEGFRYEVVARWGDRFGDVRFGTNADFTALVPVEGTTDEYFLVVNHEYISALPWLQGYCEAHGQALPALVWKPDLLHPDQFSALMLEGEPLFWSGMGVPTALRADSPIPEAVRSMCTAALDDLGVSVLHVRQEAGGEITVLRDSSRHARFSGTHPTSATFGNCSGGQTPWGTVLSGEENYQDYVRDAVDARGEFPGPLEYTFGASGPGEGTDLPLAFSGLGEGLDPSLDGRDFGWICEIDPERATLRKLRRLGRLRHENASVACAAGAPLVVYEGDDLRGGHVWRFESRALVADPRDRGNSALFDEGTLFVAKFAPDGSGRWIALSPATPLARPRPEDCTGGVMLLPDRRVARPGEVPAGTRVPVVADTRRSPGLSVDQWVASVERACGRPFDELTLGDLVWPPGHAAELSGAELAAHRARVIELEAFAMANAVGGTPTARPEDVELHPGDGSLYIAFSDATGSTYGSPDRHMFPDSQGTCSRQYGGIVRLAEDPGADGRPRTFRWSRFLASGELHESGGAFACPDNLCFDPDGNLWMTCDLTTGYHNVEVDRGPGTSPGSGPFQGVFGSNALFYVPTRGPDAGKPICFAIGPAESELTGPTFTPDGRALILSVQHPGEMHGTRGAKDAKLPTSEQRRFVVAARDGATFEQVRSVPLGSNWPSRALGTPPRACVVCITRPG